MKRLLCILMVSAVAVASQAQIRLSTENSTGALPLVAGRVVATIVTDEADAPVVATAADCVAHDMEAVTGRALATSHQPTKGRPTIIAGTVGQSPLVDALIARGKVDASEVAGRREAYSLQLVDDGGPVLAIIGGTPRGTAYGLFHLSRLAGVSPWIWWADVAPEQQAALYVVGDRLTVGEPSVKYRGIFINDEDFALFPWASNGIDQQYHNIGPNTYAKVMELLLRLRANTLWPAMHLCSEAFWANKANLPVAKKYDIMLGSSHCEQMLRDNEWEWRHGPWNGNNEDWNYVTNKAKIERYWEERVAESVGYDGMYTLGMRGVHDWGIGGYPTTDDKVRGLTEIIGFQRQLLGKYFGDATKVPQLFIPYKEVLDAYNAGLQVPEDVTLCWVDDNHGYIRQLPKPAEQARQGGNGVYYHLSYWGTPADYLWIASHSPSIISYELSRAYDQGIRTLWVINVGDIKPAEMELEFCMDLAWDINQWTPTEAIGYNRAWAARTFGEAVADELAAIKADYYRLAAGGKPEHLHIISYTDDDKDRRISDYEALAERVDALKPRIPDRLRDAFFQLIEYPVKGAYYMNVKTFRAAQSIELGKRGHREQALQYAADARHAFRMIEQLTYQYNHDIADGKWNGMMSYKPRGLEQFNMPATATAKTISSVVTPLEETDVAVIAATDYQRASSTVTTIEGLGINRGSVTVWPLDMTAYDASATKGKGIGDAPYVEYAIPVKAGKNRIEVRCLPNFPINTNYDLRVALTLYDVQRSSTSEAAKPSAAPSIQSLKTVAMEGKWHTTVAQGYNAATTVYESTKAATITLRVSLLDPGVVISEIRNTVMETSGNPIAEGWYADPEAVIIDGKCWVFPTFSAPYDEQLHFDAFSSDDMVHWTKHPNVLTSKKVKWARRAMWAPAIVAAQGRYYLFFSANDVHEGEVGGIGVAVSKKPQGPYKDALGKPLIQAIVNGAQPIDQFVFRDDDGQYYMYYGGWGHCNVVRLSDDLLSIVPFADGDSCKEVTPERYVEGPFMLKRAGKYYFMWSEGGWGGPDYCVSYAISDSPLGPFKRIGKILEQDPKVATGAGHHSVVGTPSGEWYIVYHRRPLGETDANHRVVCIDRMEFDEQGLIKKVAITSDGVQPATLE